MSFANSSIVAAEDALKGRIEAMQLSNRHIVTGQPIQGPFASDLQSGIFAMGCFWGAERCFWQQHGVVTTAVGYAGGYTPNPTYEETCSGLTGHTEAVLVVFDPAQIGYADLLSIFWESHDSTQGMRQGNDRGSQYRSAIYCADNSQLQTALNSTQTVQPLLNQRGYSDITTEIREAPEFYYAEDYHQQYLAKNPQGYCGLRGTGINCQSDSQCD